MERIKDEASDKKTDWKGINKSSKVERFKTLNSKQ